MLAFDLEFHPRFPQHYIMPLVRCSLIFITFFYDKSSFIHVKYLGMHQYFSHSLLFLNISQEQLINLEVGVQKVRDY
jgi:hypothetical protein